MSDLLPSDKTHILTFLANGQRRYVRKVGFKRFQPTPHTFDAEPMSEEEAEFWIEHLRQWFATRFESMRQP